MDGLEIATEQVVSAGGAVEGIGRQLAAEITRMETILGDLQGAWRSSVAAPRFAAVMQSHLAEARTLQDVLIGHGAGLATAGRTLAEAEAALSQAIPGV